MNKKELAALNRIKRAIEKLRRVVEADAKNAWPNEHQMEQHLISDIENLEKQVN